MVSLFSQLVRIALWMNSEGRRIDFRKEGILSYATPNAEKINHLLMSLTNFS